MRWVLLHQRVRRRNTWPILVYAYNGADVYKSLVHRYISFA